MEEPSKFIFKDHPLNYFKGLSIESDNGVMEIGL